MRLSTAGIMLIAVALAGCDDKVESFGGPTMGSTYSIKYVRGAEGPSVQQAQAEVEALLAQVDQQMSTYRDDSLVSKFNTLPAGSCRNLPENMLALVRYGERLANDSDGAFDLTVEPLLDLWGFGPKGQGERVPSPEQIALALQRVGHRHLKIDGQRLCKDADIKLDFDAIAAGDTVDRVAALLEHLGVNDYLVEITGELKTKGRKPDGSAWSIAIEAPRDDERVAQMVLKLRDMGISTSGDYRNYFEVDGQRYSHTFDPRLGRPISHKLASVTVASPLALHADGMSTLLMVLGPEQGYRFALDHRLAALFITREAQGFSSLATPAFQRLMANPL
jgi:thiamine biosynthesis lipoprotein